MILIPDPDDGVHRSVHAAQDAGDPLLRRRPGDRSRATAVTRGTWPSKAEDVHGVDRHRRHGVLRPRARVLHLRRRSLRLSGELRVHMVDSVEGIWNTGKDEGPNLGYKPRTKQGYFPVPPMDHYQDLRSEMASTLKQVGIEVELHHHEVATAGQGEIGTKFNTLLAMGDQLMTFKYVLKNVRLRGRQDAHVHAEADLPGQRLGHAHPPVAVEGRQAAVLLGDRLRRPVRHRAVVHRRAPASRCGDPRIRRADDELVQAPGARLRGAGEPRLLAAQPLGSVPHPARAEEPEGQAGRVPLPRRIVEPVPGVLGDAHGRPRWRAEPHRASAPRSTRTSTTCRPRSSPRCRRCPARSTSR